MSVAELRSEVFSCLYYRPQWKFAKVMSSQVSVCSQRGGVSVSVSGGSPSRGVSVQGVSVQGGSLSRRGSLSRVTSGRYVSYWNACLLPAATKLGQGNKFTGICLSTGGRGYLAWSWGGSEIFRGGLKFLGGGYLAWSRGGSEILGGVSPIFRGGLQIFFFSISFP